MRIVIVGATGMLGQALYCEASCRGAAITGIARSGTDCSTDITYFEKLEETLYKLRPDVIINAAALTNLAQCEQEPATAYLVNARAVASMAEVSSQLGAFFVQVSTDHYFVNDGKKQHEENAAVHLVNEYARTKYAGEAFALTYPAVLVVRTNIVGFRQKGHPTFVEWVIESLQSGRFITLFDDYYTSSIHVAAFARSLFDLLPSRPSGILNLAARDVCSKKVFVEMLAESLNLQTSSAVTGSAASLTDAKRASSVGLNVSKAEQLLGYDLPTTFQVARALADEYRRMTS